MWAWQERNKALSKLAVAVENMKKLQADHSTLDLELKV